MATFKESYRLERVYFEKLKSMIDILKSFLDGETDEKTRVLLTNAIDDNGAILLLYRNLGEAWAELADLIQKLRNDMNDLDEKEEAYHDELNERIDEVNNYLMALIRDLQARMDAVEADLAQMGRLFTYDLTRDGQTYALAESGNAVTFAETVAKFTHIRPHFVAVRNGANYYLIDTYDLTTGTGAVTWSGWKFTQAGEIVQTIVTLNADNSVSVTETATNFASILSRLTAVEGRVDTLEDCCEDVEEALEDIEDALDGKQDTLTAGANITITNNVISASGGVKNYIIQTAYNAQLGYLYVSQIYNEKTQEQYSGTLSDFINDVVDGEITPYITMPATLGIENNLYGLRYVVNIPNYTYLVFNAPDTFHINVIEQIGSGSTYDVFLAPYLALSVEDGLFPDFEDAGNGYCDFAPLLKLKSV